MNEFNLSQQWGIDNQIIDINLDALANNAAQCSKAIDFAALGDLIDVLIMVRVKTGSSTPSTTGTVSVFAYGAVDVSITSPFVIIPNYTESMPGIDTLVTAFMQSPPNLALLGPPINANKESTTYTWGPYSLARAFGGLFIPRMGGLVIVNNTGVALAAGASNHWVKFQPVFRRASRS